VKALIKIISPKATNFVGLVTSGEHGTLATISVLQQMQVGVVSRQCLCIQGKIS
jgi:hypothetical protein